MPQACSQLLKVILLLLTVSTLFQSCSPGMSSLSLGSTTVAAPGGSTPTPTPLPAATPAPPRSGFTLKTQEQFISIDPTKWKVQEANTAAAINLSSDPTNGFGEVEANLPNQYVLIPGGGVRIVSTHQSWSAIGGVADKQCGDPNLSTCSFPWTSSQFTGKSGLQSGYGYYEWAAKLPVVPSGGVGTWPATWLLGGQSAPQYEEIDFMERFSTDPTHIYFTLHYGSNAGDFNNSNAVQFCAAQDPSGHNWSDLHTYAVDWEPTSITGYIDGVVCGTVAQGDSPNEYGSTPAIIPSGLMFPIFNTAIAPNFNAATATNPIYLDVFHYWYYANDSHLVDPPILQISNIHVDRAVYGPGDTVTVGYTLTAGSTAQATPALSGTAILDFLGDSSSFRQGSSVNDLYGGWYYFPLSTTIAAYSSYSDSFTYAIPNTLPDGVYTIFIGNVESGGVSYSGDYARFVVGSGSLPAVPNVTFP